MCFHKTLSLFLSVSVFFQSITPILAMDSATETPTPSSPSTNAKSSSHKLPEKRLLSTISQVEESLDSISQYKSIPAPLTFRSEPGKTAAGILHFSEHAGEIYIFLGERSDQKDSWCNLGGGSDLKEDDEEAQVGNLNSTKATTLDEDAARESEEESNRIYTLHHRLLKKHPFIDTYDPIKKLYYRMYWQRVQHIDPEVFLNKLKDAEHEHNKEYTDFKWFKATDLLDILRDPRAPFRENIYGPLLNTLSTDSAIAFLKELSTSKKLNRYKSHIRTLSNRLYIMGNTATSHDERPIKWPLVSGRKVDELSHDQERDKKNFLRSVQELRESRAEFAQLPSTDLAEALHQLTFQPNIYEITSILSPIEQDQLDEAVAAHGMSMVLAKRRFKKEGLISQPQILPVVTPEWNPHCAETLSRIHLRIVLGPDYKEVSHFSDQLNPDRAADIANMQLYFSRYKKAETANKQAEFKREIILQDSDYEFLADVLAWETEKRIWPTSFHGASGKVNNLIKAFTYQRQLFDMDDHNESMFLRGTDIYFKGIQGLRDLIEKEGKEESDRNRAAMLFMNFVLFAGLQTTRSTSSSVEYVLNDHSVNEVDVNDRYEEATALAGFLNPNYGPFQSIHEQFKGNKDRKRGNSVLLAISQSPVNFDDYNYPTGGGGFYWSPQGGLELKEMPSAARILQALQAEYERQKLLEGDEPFEVEIERKRTLVPENRGYLDPRRLKDSSQIHIKTFDRFKLTEEEVQAYDHQMMATTVAAGADWLSARSQILEGSFVDEPVLKKMHKSVVKGVTGEHLKESLSHAGFIHLIRNGQLDGVKKFLQLYPKIFVYGDLTPQKLMETALESENPDLIRYLAEDVLKTDLRTALGLENSYVRFREALSKENLKIVSCLLSQFDSKIIPDDVKLLWLRLANSFQIKLSILQYILKEAPHLSKEAFENILSSQYLSEEAYETLMANSLIAPQALLTLIYDRMMKGVAREYDNTQIPIKVCLERGANLATLHPVTGEPLVFMVPELKGDLCPEIISWLKDKPDVLKLVNSDGLSLLQVTQKGLLEGASNKGLFDALLQLCKSAQQDYNALSYRPFIDYFGPAEFWSAPILNPPESIEWVEKLQLVANSQQAETLVASCPYPELLQVFGGKISSFGYYDSVKKQRDLESAREQWIQNIKLSLSDKPLLQKLLDEAPSAHLRHVLYLFSDEKHVEGLSRALQRLYPIKKDFMMESETVTGTTMEYPAHPVIYMSQQKAHKSIIQCYLSFLGHENFPQFFFNLSSYEQYNLKDSFSEEEWNALYDSAPTLFTGVYPDGRDMFAKSLMDGRMPLSLKQRIVKDNAPRLKILEKQELGAPYFWSLLLSDEQNMPLIKEEVQNDPSLLHLKSLEGLTFQQILPILPKGHSCTKALKRLFLNGDVDSPEVLPNHIEGSPS